MHGLVNLRFKIIERNDRRLSRPNTLNGRGEDRRLYVAGNENDGI